MRIQQKLPIKIGDSVTVTAGCDKNKTGEVIRIEKKTGRILVKGINYKFKHVKSEIKRRIKVKKGKPQKIKQIEAPIHHSNVKLNLKKVL